MTQFAPSGAEPMGEKSMAQNILTSKLEQLAIVVVWGYY